MSYFGPLELDGHVTVSTIGFVWVPDSLQHIVVWFVHLIRLCNFPGLKNSEDLRFEGAPTLLQERNFFILVLLEVKTPIFLDAVLLLLLNVLSVLGGNKEQRGKMGQVI